MIRKWLKRLGILALLAGIIAIILYLMPDKRINGFYLIPDDAMYILESDDPIDAWKDLSGSSVWNTVKRHPIFADITEDADYLDQLIVENKLLLKFFGSRQLYVSAHPTSRRNYDFLFLVDLRKSAKTPLLYSVLSKILRNEGFKVTSRQFDSYEILEVEDDLSDKLSLVKVDNFLLCSYTPQLIEKAIRQKQNPYFGINYDFNAVYKPIGSKGDTRLYVQWAYADEYLSCYFLNGKSFAAGLDEALLFSALELQIDAASWQLKGVTNLNPERQSYLKALLNSGSSELRLPLILSNRTAWYVSFNFSSMDRFYDELISNLEIYPDQLREFQENKDKVENLLDINLEKHLIEWIGEEVGLAQVKPANLGSSEEDFVIVLHTKDLDLARKRLDEIAAQVKKRTPAKVKSLEYKNYKIEYLAIKGFFKILFGKLFDKIEKPYFTVVGDYVLFSNSPLTLIGMIEDFENDRILANSPNYKLVLDDSEQSSLNAYVAPPRARTLIGKHLDAQGRQAMDQSAEYIDAFSAFALELQADGDLLRTRVRIVQNVAQDSIPVDAAEIRKMYETFLVDLSSYELNDSVLFRVQYTEGNVFKKFYPASEQLEVKAEVKGNVKNGDYFEYYPDGVVKVQGKYKRDKKVGTWKYYDDRGNLTQRKRY